MSQQVSNISIRFGEEFQGDGPLNIKLNFVINSGFATEAIQKAMTETKNMFESLNFSMLITFENCDKVEDLESIFTILQSDDQHEGGVEGDSSKKLSGQVFHNKMKKKLLKDLNFKTYADINTKNLYLQVTLKDSISEKVLEPFQILLESGLKDLAQNINSLEGEVCLNITSEQIYEMLKQKDRLLVPFLTQMRAKLTLSLSQNLSQQMKEVASNIDESLLNSPQLQFLEYFKNFDINLTFNSAENLPEPIRQFILPGKIDEQSKVTEKLEKDASFLNGLISKIPANVSARIFIDEFAFLNVRISAAGFKKVLTEYLGQLLKPLI